MLEKLTVAAPDKKILFTEMQTFTFDKPPVDPVELANKLIEEMRRFKAAGLAANQLNLPYRVFVMEGTPAWACFNPKIVDSAEEEIKLVEGCVTYPNLWLNISRPEWVRVRFQDPFGVTHTKVFGGYHGRVFQHELDHLDGKSYIHKVSQHVMRKAIKLRDQIEKQKREMIFHG